MRVSDSSPGWYHAHRHAHHCVNDPCGDERAEARRAWAIAQQLDYEVNQLDRRLRPEIVERTTVIEPSQPADHAFHVV